MPSPGVSSQSHGNLPNGILALVCVLVFAVALVACETQEPSTRPTFGPSISIPATPTSLPIETWWPTSDADVHTATAILRRYMKALVSSDWDSAWVLLAEGSKEGWGSEQDFASEEGAFMASARREYVLGDPKHDEALVDKWVSRDDPAAPPRARAYLSQVDYPRLQNMPAGFDILVAAPDETGMWHVWRVR
jgi:hypothetical protein